MEPPDRALELGSVLLGGTRRADDRKGLYAVPPVEPSVRPPLEAVYHVVAYAVVVPAVEHDLGLAVGLDVGLIARIDAVGDADVLCGSIRLWSWMDGRRERQSRSA